MDTITSAKQKIDKAIDHYQQEIKKLRSGRPSPDTFADIDVDAYGSRTKLSSVANINIVDASLVTIQPWDKSLVNDIVKALQLSPGNYNPQPNGDLIRLPIPAMTQERRVESVKKLKEMSESARIQVRVIRKDALTDLDNAKKSSAITEDQFKAKEKQLQQVVEEANKLIEKITEAKEESLLTV